MAWKVPRGPGPLSAHCLRGGVPGPSRAPVTTAHPSLSGPRPRCDMGPGGRPLPPALSLLGALSFGFLLTAVCLFACLRALRPLVRHSAHSFILRRSVTGPEEAGVEPPPSCGSVGRLVLLSPCLREWGWSSSSCVLRMASVMSRVCLPPSLLSFLTC